MAATGSTIANRFGSNDFEANSKSATEKVVIDWCNEGIAIMRKIITTKSKTGTGSVLAQSIHVKPTNNTGSISVSVVSDADYIDYVDKGVKGLRKNKAPGSPYAFKNLGTPPKMIESFKKWIAAAGIKSVRNVETKFKGKKRKKALSDQDKAAKGLAVATKIVGITPKKFIAPAIDDKRIKQLSTQLSKAIGKEIIGTIK